VSEATPCRAHFLTSRCPETAKSTTRGTNCQKLPRRHQERMASQMDYAITFIRQHECSSTEYMSAIRRRRLFLGQLATDQILWLTQLQNILQLLQSYNDFFDVPDYELIIQEADFRITMLLRRAASFDSPQPRGGPTAPITQEPSRPRERVQVRVVEDPMRK
jgi:hypothetical protein